MEVGALNPGIDEPSLTAFGLRPTGSPSMKPLLFLINVTRHNAHEFVPKHPTH
jgi:hypothetical protein